MARTPMWRRYLRLFGPDTAADVEDEIQFHLESKEQELIAAGWTPDAAHEEAKRQFGDVASVRVCCESWDKVQERRQEKIEFWQGWWQDIHYGTRYLRRYWGTNLMAIAALAVGIGSVTAVFSVLYAVVLHPLPFPQPDRLVMLWTTRDGRDDVVTPRNFDAWKRESRSFVDMAAVQNSTMTLADAGSTPVQVPVGFVSADFFKCFGVSPIVGRMFTSDEDWPARFHLTVLSHRFWREHFASDRSVVGSVVRLNRESYTVIGVMPASLDLLPDKQELWIPLALSGQEMNWMGGVLSVVARLRPHVTRAQAQAEMNVLARNLQTRYPEMNHGRVIRVQDYTAGLVGDYRQQLWLLLGAVTFVLFIACANVANLILAQSTRRHQELTVRAALGATRSRLVRQLLSETFLLAVGAAVFGLVLAQAVLRTIRVLGAAGVPRMSEASINMPVLVVAFCVAAITTVLCGLVPALQSARVDLQTVLRQAGRGLVGSFQDRARGIYIGAQVALALTLLTAAGLLIRSALAATHVDPGFVAEDVMVARTALPSTTYHDAAAIARTYNQILDTLASQPGVVSAAIASKVPLGISGAGLVLRRQEVTPPLKEDLSTELHYISAGYFAALRIRLLSGRNFTPRDRSGNRQVVIVSESLARKLWPVHNPIGQTLRLPELEGEGPLWEVIGVADDVHDNGMMVPRPSVLYVPFLQVSVNPWHWVENSMYVIARVHHGISSAAAIDAAVHSVDPELPVSDLRSMGDRVAQSISAARMYGLLMSALGVCGLVLTAAGIYGVVSYFVARQRPDIGVRVALGATRGRIIGLVLRQGMRPVAVGIVIGFAASLACSPLMASELYGVRAIDPRTLLTVPALLAAVAMLACYIPAWQASRVDPAIALRSE